MASLLVLSPKVLPWMVSKNWCLVSEKSGNYFYPNDWQPWYNLDLHTLPGTAPYICQPSMSEHPAWSQGCLLTGGFTVYFTLL